jgi:hypothetical protein
MKRAIAGVVAGLAVWVVVAGVAGVVIRSTWPAYVAVADTMAFSLAMKVVRLSIGALATLAAGWVVGVIARSTTAALTAGAILLLLFIPQHISLWDKFPVWYHLTFLLSLVPLCWAGGTLAARPA